MKIIGKNVGSSLRSFFLYDGLSKDDYLSIKMDMHEQNRSNLFLYTLVMSFIFLALVISSILLEPIRVNLPSYLVAFLCMAAISSLLSTVAKGSPLRIGILNYVFATLIIGFTIYIGTITANGQMATSICVCMAIIPFVTYDIVLRSALHRLLLCLVFFVIDFHLKDYTIVYRDLINVSCYFLIGTLVAGFSQSSQASAMYLRRNMNVEIRRQTENLARLSSQSVRAMADAIDAKDKYTNGHSLRVAQYSEMIAERMGKSAEEQDNIFYVAMLHDVGKIGIPDEIINKEEKLSASEYDIIKTHPSVGYDILRKVDVMPDIAIGARYHHERYDGTGYPAGLAGENIPEIARIIAVADAYDAMTSKRSYRGIMEKSRVAEEIRNGKGTQFDPAIADIMLAIMKDDTEYQLHG